MHWCVSLHWSTHRGACTLMHFDAFSLLNLKLNYVYDIYVVVHCLIHFTLWCPRTLYTDSHCKLCFGTGLYFILLWIVWHLCYTLYSDTSLNIILCSTAPTSDVQRPLIRLEGLLLLSATSHPPIYIFFV